MNKIYLKLAASVLSILIALTMVVGATFAWFTLSQSPEVGGINVTIGGGRTILLAPDVTEVVDTEGGEQITVHYPGEFSSTLNITQEENYILSPVSTSDGLYWLIPSYDDETGELKEFREFQVDQTLENANVKQNDGGSYIVMDFWIVSPGSEFDIRVSTDTKKNSGSFLKELPKAEKTEDGSFVMTDTEGIIESIARVGFLVNTDSVGEEAAAAYEKSENYISQYEILSGIYQEKGSKISVEHLYQFTIYEPNGTSHPSEMFADGEYLITEPLSYDPTGKSISTKNISSQLMIQDRNEWIMMGENSKLEQFFQTYIVNKNDLTAEEATSKFYTEYEYVKGQLGDFIKSGNFYKRTAAVYEKAENGVVSAPNLGKLMNQGATDDVAITTISPNTPQRIRMYIWLEGQDADCVNSASVKEASFALNLEFAGANQ